MTTGMHRENGQPLSGRDHIEQSVVDILTTPIGSRVLNREYGSALFDLIDTPISQATLPDFHAAVIGALARWEPRIRVTHSHVSSAAPGRLEISIDGILRADGREITIEGIEIA